MKKKRLLITAAFLVGVVVIMLILFYSAPATVGDIHYYHHDLTQEDADNGLGFDYGKSDNHALVDTWRVSLEKRMSKDTSLLADWYYLLVKDCDIEESAEKGNTMEAELVKDEELRQEIYTKVCEKLDGAVIEEIRWAEGTKYLTGIMTPEAPTTTVPILDSKEITTTTPLTLMAIYANPSKNGDGTLTAYCIPGCGDQPAEPVGKVKATVVSHHKPHKPSPKKPDPKKPEPKKPEPEPTPTPEPTPQPTPTPPPTPDEPTGCSDTQTWEPSYGQQAEKYTDSKTGGGNSHMNTEDPPVSGTTRIDEDSRIKDGWTTKPDVPTTPPVVSGGTGRVSGDD